MSGLTVEGFIDAFRERHHWECKPGTRITNELTKFAQERAGSKRNVDELYVVFCMAYGLCPYPLGKPVL